MLGIVVNYILNYRYTFGSDQHHHVVIPKFLTEMTVGMFINAVVMYAAINWLGLHYLLAQVNYILNYRYTFGSDQHHHVVIPKFLTEMTVGMFINAVVMYAAINWLGLHYLLAQLTAMAVVLMWSYTANRLWAFAD